jgi:ABC-type nitrate/sulfonate/bicarbonate transport system substrate-binding protein
MAIQVTVDHFHRLVIGVAQGTLVLQDLVAFGLEVLKASAVPYGKIIDVATATPGFSQEELRAFAKIVRDTQPDTPRGPLAFVIDPKRGDMARLFTGLEVADRPANLFRTIHEARRWMNEQIQARAREDDGWGPS